MDGSLNPIQPENDLGFLKSVKDDPSALPSDRAVAGYMLGELCRSYCKFTSGFNPMSMFLNSRKLVTFNFVFQVGCIT